MTDDGPRDPWARRRREPRPFTSLYHLLEHHARRTPERTALLAPARRPLHYGALFEQVNDTARALHNLGVRRADRVAVVMPNGPELAVVLLAVAASAVGVPLNPNYAADEWHRHFCALRVRLLVVRAGFGSTARTVARRLGIPVVDLLPDPDAAAGVFALAGSPSGAAVEHGAARPGDDAFVLPTSGTTSRPKPVPLTHANVCHSVFNTGSTLSLASEDRLLGVLPLHHAHGLISGLLASLGAGSSVVCTPRFVASEFLPWLAEFRPSWYTAVPAIHQAVLAQAAPHRRVASSLRFIRSASAPLPPHVLQRLEKVFGVPVIETYGMTEAASQIASNLLPPGRRKPGSVGPAAGPEVAIMDPAGAPLSPGEPGEIVLRGPNITRGYEGSAEAGEAAFTNGWLRTGDRGYLDADGYLFIIGRTKEIINRGGEKIAPSEVEQVIGAHPDVAQVVVFASPHPRLGEDVAAAVVLRPGARATARDLRSHAAAHLALFKVPRRIVFVAEIPVSPTGKVRRLGLAQRLGLSAPSPVGTRRRRGHGGPHTELERRLVEIWTQVLAVEGIGVEADFFALGGDSLAAAQIISRMREQCGGALSFDDFFDAPTIAEQARRLETSGPTEADGLCRLPAAPPDEAPARLSFPQLRLYFLERLGHCHAYHVLTVAWTRGELNCSALEGSLAAVIARHEILRTTFLERDGEPLQVVRRSMPPPLTRVDLSQCAESDRDEAIASVARAAVGEPFDLVAGPLLRMRLLRFDAETHALVVTFHHLITDGWSQRLFWDELAVHYGALSAGRPPSLPEPSMHYRQFARWQHQWVETPVADEQRTYWRAQLGGVTALPLLTDHPRPAQWLPHGARHPVRLSRRLSGRLRALSRNRGATVFMTLLAGFLALLHRYTSHDDLAVGTLVACRRGVELERLMGMCANTVVLRTDLSENPSFDELLHRVRRVTLDAYRHQELPFEQVLQVVPAPRSADRNPLFQVLFMLRRGSPAGPQLPGLAVDVMEVDPGTARFDLVLEVSEIDGRFQGWFEYCKALFEPASIARMAGHLRALLEAVAANPARPVSSLPLLTARERSGLRGRRNVGRPTRLPRAHLHRLFALQAARTPDAIAVRCKGKCLRFGELNARANQLAYYLRRQGIGPGHLVGLLVDRDLEMVIGMLGILKAGAAYVPLDPRYPEKRLSFMMENAGLAALVTEKTLAAGFAQPSTALVQLDGDWPAIARECQDDPKDDPSPDGLAYVLYTSGSSGQPKGVLGTHEGVVNALQWTWRTFPFAEAEVCCHRTSISFGDSVQELFGPLLKGVPLVVIGTEVVVDPPRLIRTLARHRVTRIILVPSLLRALLEWDDDLDRALPHLRLWMTSGEALSSDLARRFHEVLPGRRLINIYGASEMSDVVTWHEVDAADRLGRAPPIGRPIANTEVFVLGDGLEPMPVGVPGELCVAGRGLARGYLRRPELDSEKFIPNPFDAERYPRLYRTGDMARFRADGRLDYLGRKDNQVQVRGCRVEVDEVEAVLEAHPGVRQAAVVPRQTGEGGVRLAAFVSSRRGSVMGAHELHRLARDTLPAYMLPSEYVFLDAMPLTPSGKVDRRALAAMTPGVSVEPWNFVAPRSPTEEMLLGIWQDLLQVDEIGVFDSFFELGGHSLIAGQVLARVENVFDVSLPLRVLFDAPTVAELARRIDAARSMSLRGSAEGPEPTRRDRPVAVSIAQESMLRIERALPGLPFFNLPYAFRLLGRLDVGALERSLAEVICRHEALRTVFATVEGRWVQAVTPPIDVSLQPDDLEPLRPCERDRMVQLAARTQAWTPIDVHEGPPLRMRLLRLGEEDHVLLVTVHHIIMDGWSLGIILEEISLLYHALTGRCRSDLPEASLQCADFADWQRRWCDGKEAAAQYAFWRDKLRGIAPVFRWGGERAEPQLSLRTARAQLHLPGDLISRLADLSRRENSTLFLTLLAGFKASIQAETGHADICIATVLANRSRRETERIVGLLENTILVRTALDERMSFRETLGRVRDAVLEAQARQELPFAALAARLHQDFGVDLMRSVSAMLVFQNAARHPLDLAGLAVRAVDGIDWEGQPVLPLSQTRLTLILKQTGWGIAATCVYKQDQLGAERIERLLARYVTVLDRASLEPRSTLRNLAVSEERLP